ncbi:hypothetical protein AB0383_03560 [Amycolatopsis sp. NPDC051373]|uniref:hypothetical protein n=1 Tax=Amycolatopsis sp. NPDC051373 TaxID=3155801 RepID=UPI0034502805
MAGDPDAVSAPQVQELLDEPAAGFGDPQDPLVFRSGDRVAAGEHGDVLAAAAVD